MLFPKAITRQSIPILLHTSPTAQLSMYQRPLTMSCRPLYLLGSSLGPLPTLHFHWPLFMGSTPFISCSPLDLVPYGPPWGMIFHFFFLWLISLQTALGKVLVLALTGSEKWGGTQMWPFIQQSRACHGPDNQHGWMSEQQMVKWTSKWLRKTHTACLPCAKLLSDAGSQTKTIKPAVPNIH